MPIILTESTTSARVAACAENAAADQKLSQALQQALTADKNGLFCVMQAADPEIVLAALRNPVLDPQHLQALLQRRGLGTLPAAIYAAKHLLESNQVKCMLVCHPETPVHIALALLPLLYLFDLLKISQMPGVATDIHLAAERTLIQRLPTQPLGNKLTLARRGSAAVAESLLREGLPHVVEACLDNPHLKEGPLYQFLCSAQANAETISMVARSSRWKSRPNIRLAILKNPRTPIIWYTLFLPGLPQATLRDLLASPRLTFAQKELVRRAGRAGQS